MKAFIPLLALLLLLSVSPVHAATKSAGTLATASSEWEFDRSNKDFRIHFGEETLEELESDEEGIINNYVFRNGRLYGGLKKYDTKNRKSFVDYYVWDMFAGIANKDILKKYVVTYGTYDNYIDPKLAFVARDRGMKKEPSWLLAVNTNGWDLTSNAWTRNMAITLLHEYGHLVTMNKGQMDHSKSREACAKQGGYFQEGRQFGCSNKKSYVQAFYAKFWTASELAAARKDVEKGTDSFYRANRSSFVTKYAATNPAEDIAESFADFILRKKPTGTSEKDLKVLFFYDYPELVKERDRIRGVIVGYLHL